MYVYTMIWCTCAKTFVQFPLKSWKKSKLKNQIYLFSLFIDRSIDQQWPKIKKGNTRNICVFVKALVIDTYVYHIYNYIWPQLRTLNDKKKKTYVNLINKRGNIVSFSLKIRNLLGRSIDLLIILVINFDYFSVYLLQ